MAGETMVIEGRQGLGLESVAEILALAASSAAPAIGAPGRLWLDGAGLAALADEVRHGLNRVGVGRDDRVAILLPNGPEMACSFLAVAATATAAPLNPAYRSDELDFYLSDLEAKVLIVDAGETGPGPDAAARLRIPVLRLSADSTAAAGSFTLDFGAMPERPAARGGIAQPDDVALVLHTSGTTAKPKLVPLTGRNVAASARHIGAALGLKPDDRCLNVMPLFHIHGLIAAVLASVAAGASVSCTPGFNALRFMALLGEIRPTWYTAVPTMHQAILMRMRGQKPEARASGLRLIRSSSASLPPQVMVELEEVFGAPVIESYGMTEAAHQMTSNPLPPRGRKPGAVGVAAGPEVAILGDDGTVLPQGETGEVVIRGPNVTLGYHNNPDANAKGFIDGWFRTGDQGRLDEEGYLTITGRLKELINRGGEKVSPLEVDTVLMDHPAVAQAVTFAMPHDKLGEEVAAAIVLREGAATDERAIREFAGARLAAFKVPRRVVILDEIPKGATGKLQRIGLAQKLGLAGDAAI